jgi:Flp pilus assembly protein TadG
MIGSPFAFVRRFLRARRGATAVEFAFVALPFISLLFATLELGMVFLVQTTLDNATDEAGRQIRTGVLQTAGGTAATFKTAVCNEMTWMGSACATNLSVDVRTFTSFAGQAPPTFVTGGVYNPATMTFTPGTACNIVLVRTYYPWTIFTPLLNAGLVNVSTNKRLIQSAASFRNEPFGGTSC